MPIPLPVLDDRRWADLVEQGRALVPLYSPEWTDHNASDPGITLIELFAFLAEMDIFRLNRIPEAHKRKFLALLGVRPEPPKPAIAVAELRHAHSTDPVALPASAEFAGTALDGTAVPFRSIGAINITTAKLRALQCRDAAGFRDATAIWERGESIPIFGEIPATGAEFYLGFDKPLPPNQWISLYFDLGESNWQGPRTPHHSVRLVWESLSASGWTGADQDDATRSLTLNGTVRIRASAAMAPHATGKNPASLHYLRCRLASGSYDAPPVASRILLNGVELQQAVPLWQTFPITKGSPVTGTGTPGNLTGLTFKVQNGAISELHFTAPQPDAPAFRLLGFTLPSALTNGSITLEAMQIGTGTAEPSQSLTIPRHPVLEDSARLYSLEGATWRAWERVDDFTASTRTSAHYTLDATTGDIRSGDGERGRVFPGGAILLMQADNTLAANANAAAPSRLADSPHNRANLAAPGTSTITVASQIPATGGEAAEPLAHAIGRAIQLRESSLRAVTVQDFETIALETPGTHIARAKAIPNLFPGLDCISAPGVMTVILVPAMPGPRPTPSAGLLSTVATRLNTRRIIGTRIEVVGPQYLEIAVRARVISLERASQSRLALQIQEALDAFFDPIHGGPDRTGWPFGRDVFRSEVLQVIDEIPGVDYVAKLDLIAEGAATCGNVCLPPTCLVAAGQHEIEVL